MTSRKLISFDWAIKKILRSKANFGILEGFLSELLFTDITILEVLESESNQEMGFDKYNRVDIKVADADQRIILIEVQYSRELDYLQRILFASSKTITEHLIEGAAYAEVSKVISVNILYFDFGKGDDYIYHGTTNFIGLHNHSVLELSAEQKNLYKSEKIADIYPEYYLIEIRNFNDVAKDSLDEWIYFLKNEEIKEDFTAKGLKQAKETLNVLKMSEQERLAYDRHQTQLHHEASIYQSTYVLGQMEGHEAGFEAGHEKGHEKGHKKGKEEGILLMAKNMKQAGIAIATIMQVTGLSVEQIDKL
ncbi:Rpn family recombination-promoting nuclease/putative transposase [Candidatus Venteria ishoeyi]|uniref:PD-(D/E)XK nuclease family transposase n=1 Tax=Candidatus Venteria ishoeyi TaxID=1899563 RepID=A0A1H6F7V1_9GAMM|nr:Rpn family recombination-promoting nuclease/putative transposase [Candidatus Venteria ishoeyi]SEH06200.1 PD-(D/E)XK nuclease family transposase [Candidatus Venteria ishoeyi]